MTTSELTVSLVVPAFNHAAYLEQALESALAQTYPGIELIVLDDGSTDATAGILDRYAGRFHFESQKNIGQAATLNKGWALAHGDVLGYLSADDYLHPEAVSEAVAALARHPDAVAVYPDFELVDDSSRTTGTVRTPEFDYRDMVLRMVCPPGPGAFFRRTAFASEGGWNEQLRRIPDFEFWLRLGLRGGFVRIPKVLAYYRVHAGAQSFSPVDSVRADEYVNVIEALLESGRLPAEIQAESAMALATAGLNSARLHLVSGRYRVALRRTLTAVRGAPGKILEAGAWRLLASGLVWRIRVRRQT